MTSRILGLLVVISSFGVVACSSDDGGTPPASTTTDAGSDADVPDPALAIACTDASDAIYGPWSALPDEKGAILKCAKDAPIAKADLEVKAKAAGYVGAPFTSGAKVYRILFRTERGSTPVLAGASSALVYLPDTPRAEKAPLVVFGHGSRGQAAKCAPSKFTPEGEYVRDDFEANVLPLVGAGYPVIAPDWAGYANYGAEGNPPSGYAASEDVAKSMLDATRAFRKLAPSIVSDDVIVTGHSQGGHTALSTLAFAESYGMAGTLKGVVVFAPLWLAQRSWGAINLLPDLYNFKDQRSANAVSIFYHYTHGELLDGPGGGLLMFQESKRAGIKKFVDESCWAADYPLLNALGTKPTDVFDPEFVAATAEPAAAGSACPSDEPKKSLCEKWMARYKADRPKLTGEAAKVPVLFVYGNKDTTLAPSRMTCARDWLKTTGGNVTYCVEPEADHVGIVGARASWVNDWIAARTLGAPEPSPCPKGADDIVDDTGKPATCDPVPPNE